MRIAFGGASARRHGRGVVEVLVIVAVLGFFLLWALMALPRGRETARLAACQKNLMQIGAGLQLYHEANRHYPTVPTPGQSPGDSPIQVMLDSLAMSDFLDQSRADRRVPAHPTRGTRVAGLGCPSDPNAMSPRFPAAISYRANAGETATGGDGPFEPGRITRVAEIEAADGLSYTAAFAERLVGDGVDRRAGPMNYAIAPGPVVEAGCPDLPADRWRGDAGSDWAEAGWRSTLYGHLLPPDGSPSCIADDRRTAAIGASSAHPNRINVLLLDGSLRGVTPTMDLKLWRALGTVGPVAKPTP